MRKKQPDGQMDTQALDVPPTVLQPPQSGVELISRPHVFGVITEIQDGALCKLVAPAGSGKTTVLAQAYEQLRNEGVAVVWLSITSLANDFHRFLLQLIAAVRTVFPQFAASLPSLLESATPNRFQEVVTRLALAFAGGIDGRRLVVILDDYHCIDEPLVPETLALLLDHLPSDVHVIVGSRTEPELPLARRRARGKLVELGWEQLQFSKHEAAALFELRGCNLSAEEFRRLYAATEGWATGLQLASLNLTGGEASESIGDQPLTQQIHVTDYWLDAVLARLSERLQTFLLYTSVLDSLTPDLCDAVCGMEESADRLAELERYNLFIFRLDEQELWFRYHHLFRDFLLTRLRRTHTDQLNYLHLSASQWFEEQGNLSEATEFALRGHDVDRAARLLVPYGRFLFRAGRFKELRLSLKQLPDTALIESAELCILNGWSYGYGGEFELAHSWSETARVAATQSENRAAFEAEIAVLEGTLGVIQNDEPNRRELHPKLMEKLEHTDSSVQAFAHIALGYAYRSEGRLPEAAEGIEQAIRSAERNDCSLINMLARYNHAALALLRGERSVAESSARGSMQIAKARNWNDGMGAAFVRAQLGAILYEANRLDASVAELDEAVETLKATDAYGFLGVALLMRARTHWARGRTDASTSDLEAAEAIGESRQVERVRFKKALLDARMALAEGQLERARRALLRAEAHTREPPSVTPWSEQFEQVQLASVRLHLAERKSDVAAQVTERLRESARAAGRFLHWLEGAVLGAEAAFSQDDEAQGDRMLHEALAFADEQALWRPFFHVGPHIRDKVASLARAGSVSAARLDEVLNSSVTEKRAHNCEPLHAREVQILNLVSEGVKNREIGQRLFISEETVKWYLKGLYRKLDVGNRTAAVARAREYGLLGGT